MELLKQRILQDGRCYPGGILKVDSFINHQMDPMLMYKTAEEFIRRYINDLQTRGKYMVCCNDGTKKMNCPD